MLDAACCPADIAYPQGVNLLNQAREKLEQTVDEICKATGERKPRMYRKRARKDYLRLSKSKKRSAKAIRSAVKKQLQYINEVEGVFGTGKTAYGLGRIPAHLEDTSCCVIGITLLLMNLTKM